MKKGSRLIPFLFCRQLSLLEEVLVRLELQAKRCKVGCLRDRRELPPISR